MGRVKSDLENYRYRNVLRARDTTVGALQQADLLMNGKIDVAADSTSRMPKHVRDDIADAMKGKRENSRPAPSTTGGSRGGYEIARTKRT